MTAACSKTNSTSRAKVDFTTTSGPNFTSNASILEGGSLPLSSRPLAMRQRGFWIPSVLNDVASLFNISDDHNHDYIKSERRPFGHNHSSRSCNSSTSSHSDVLGRAVMLLRSSNASSQFIEEPKEQK